MTFLRFLRLISFIIPLFHYAYSVCCMYSSMPSMMSMQMPLPPPSLGGFGGFGGMSSPYYNYELNNPLGSGSAWAASGGLIGNLLSFIAG
ncbi:hypothetical protein OESDEN_04479 [Oesophagostomum dentatum]|uniref:Uncharacterized protein n=1 Tax=Oesophagostomum dentatum TaxID=61180 RepID=A0A0B1TID8_OESDE|nr:hypothetical protein OESDEN_04479 [Oesophagostomum dentatum]